MSHRFLESRTRRLIGLLAIGNALAILSDLRILRSLGGLSPTDLPLTQPITVAVLARRG